ncbi:MAG TPA: HAD-IA family hydrolase [Blastocatellia bacterium]|nr:HAD-IA family hydrolase [Blastocatellia bacterium]
MTQEPRAVIWDMDGTLIDSAEYHWRAWREVLADEGFELTRERFAESFGRRNDATLRAYFGEGFPSSEIERIGAIKEARYRDMVRRHGVELLPGVGRWLAHLKVNGWRQALASSASLLNVEVILGALDITSCFDAIVSADDVQSGKPDPEAFLVAAARVSVPPARCVVVEDAPAGIEGARLAGMRTIGVQSSHTSLRADVVVRTLDYLPEDTFDSLILEAGESRRIK